MNSCMPINSSKYRELQGGYFNAFSGIDLEFSYGDTIFSSFSKSTEGWMGRKVVALPLAAVAIVKVIYHLSMSLFEGLKSTYLQDTDAKMYAFCVGRDLEEFLGHLITLFSDRVGCYLVEESAYQKMCYFLASNKIEGLSSSELQPYLRFLSVKALGRISGPQLQGLDLSTLDSWYFSQIFPREGTGSFSEETKSRFAGLSAVQIQPVLSELSKVGLLELISREQLQGLHLSGSDIQYFSQIFPREGTGSFSEETKSRFAGLSAVQIQPVLSELSKVGLLELISREQLQGLDLSALDSWDFSRIFPREYDKSFSEETRSRFAGLSAAQIQFSLAKLSDVGLLELISREQLQGFDLSTLDSWDFSRIFPIEYDEKSFSEETRSRFAYLTAVQIQPVLSELSKVGLLELISREQFQGLDLSGLGSWYLSEIFPREDDGSFSEETKSRFAGLSTAQIQPILIGLIDNNLLELVSKEQFQGVDLSKFHDWVFKSIFLRGDDGSFPEETKARIASLSAAQIQSSLAKLGDIYGLLHFVSREQLQGLDLSTLDIGCFSRIFPREDDGSFSEETKSRFASLSAAQIQPVLLKLIQEGLFKLVSKEQLQGLDLSRLDHWIFWDIFPREFDESFLEETKARFAILSTAQIQPILSKLIEARLFELVSKEQIQGINWDSISVEDLIRIFSVGYPTEESRELFHQIEPKETREGIIKRIEKSNVYKANSFRSQYS